MNKPSLLRVHPAAAIGALLTLGTAAVLALEPRTWVVLDSGVIEAELKKVSGTQITLLDKENRQVVVDKSKLSAGDLDYIKENSPEDKQNSFAAKTGPPPALPVPAKAFKIDPKTFVKATNTFSIPNHESFSVLETPHFKIMYSKPAEPNDLAETAERMWFDAAFFHSTFTQQFRQRKMAIFLCPTEASYNYVGEWYADMLAKAGNKDASTKTKATWPKSAAGTVRLSRDIADDNQVLEEAPVFRATKPGSTGAKPEMVKGVWDPFRVHCLAEAMLDTQTGYISGFGAKGYFAITVGHAYFKEVSLTGRSDTSILGATVSGSGQGNASVNSAGGFKEARNWASELKRLIRKGEIKPSLESLFGQNSESADQKVIALAYSFARYLQDSPEHLAAFNKLTEQISTSNQIPDPDGIAKIYGLADGKALEADWLKYVNGAEFH